MQTTEETLRTPLIHMDWGVDGVRYAVKNKEILVIVDTLRFSTAVVTAIARGFTIYPASDRVVGKKLADRLGAELAGKPGESKYTISPNSYLHAANSDEKSVVLPSPNGSACSELVGEVDIAFIGCLLNARAVAQYCQMFAQETHRTITIIAAGEQRAVDTGERIVYERKEAYRVFAIEDYLAAGAIISYMESSRSAEAQVCELSFVAARERLLELLLKSFSGRYLVENGLENDVKHAVQLNSYDVIPVIHNGKITGLNE
jgi:2-phosphosulfolactate phosphatase